MWGPAPQQYLDRSTQETLTCIIPPPHTPPLKTTRSHYTTVRITMLKTAGMRATSWRCSELPRCTTRTKPSRSRFALCVASGKVSGAAKRAKLGDSDLMVSGECLQHHISFWTRLNYAFKFDHTINLQLVIQIKKPASIELCMHHLIRLIKVKDDGIIWFEVSSCHYDLPLRTDLLHLS